MHLGFEHIAAHHFAAVSAHVHWVYVAFIRDRLGGLD
jgi:hypothetical protein